MMLILASSISSHVMDMGREFLIAFCRIRRDEECFETNPAAARDYFPAKSHKRQLITSDRHRAQNKQ